jgi:hypothetical protein
MMNATGKWFWLFCGLTLFHCASQAGADSAVGAVRDMERLRIALSVEPVTGKTAVFLVT